MSRQSGLQALGEGRRNPNQSGFPLLGQRPSQCPQAIERGFSLGSRVWGIRSMGRHGRSCIVKGHSAGKLLTAWSLESERGREGAREGAGPPRLTLGTHGPTQAPPHNSTAITTSPLVSTAPHNPIAFPRVPGAHSRSKS